MRTTYQGKNTEGNKVVEGPQKERVKRQTQEKTETVVESTAEEISPRSEEKVREYQALYNTLVEAADVANSIGDTMEVMIPEEPKKKSKLKPLLICLVLLAVVGTGGYFLLPKVLNKSNVSSVQSKINRLYTDETKSAIKNGITESDLAPIYEELDALQAEGKDIQVEYAELSTISLYLNDSALLDAIGYETDMKTEIFLPTLDSVKSSVEKYSSTSLALTISDRVSALRADYDTYMSLSEELQGISDFANFDKDKYDSAIKGILHEPNRNELYEVFASIVAKQVEALGEKAVEDAAKEAKDKAKDEALDALEDAKNKAEAAKEEAEKQLQEALEKQKKEKEEQESTVSAAPNEDVDGGLPVPQDVVE